mgnify:CR=1 FL=1
MPKNDRSQLEAAAQHVADGRFEDAARVYRHLLEEDPDDLEALQGLGRASELMERWTEAHDAYARALTVRPEDADLATARGECLRHACCLHQAVRAYEEAIRLSPDHLFAWAGLGESLRLLGRSEEAIEAFAHALTIDGSHAFALRGRAASLSALGRYVDAIPSWELALSLMPRSSFVEQGLREARAFVSRGDRDLGWPESLAEPPPVIEGDALRSVERLEWARALIRDGRLPEAVEAYRHAARLDPDRVDVRVELARAHESVSSADTALSAWEEVLELDSEHPEASAGVAHGLRSARRYVEALAAYDRALERSPVAGALRDQALVGRAETLRLLGRWNDALGWFAKALDRTPTHLGALKGQALTLDALGRHSEAESLWRRALAIDAEREDLRQGLSRTLEALRSSQEQGRRARAREAFTTGRERLKAGRPKEAVVALQTSTALQPAWGAAHYLLGLCYAELSEWGNAARAFGQVLLHEPDHIDASWRRADALRMVGQLTQALQAFDAALQRDPEDVRLVAGRADTLRQLGHHRQAIEGFERALTDRPRLPLAVVGKASCLNVLGRFDEAHGLWLMALQDNPSAPAVKQGLDECRRGLREGPTASARDEGRPEPLLPVRAAPTGLVPHRHRLGAEEERLPLVPAGREGRADFELGRRLYKQRRFAEAADSFRRALEADPLDADAALRLGMALEDGRRYGDAIRAYRLCLSIDPTHCQAATNIGEALRKREQYREAIDAYDEALALRDDYLYALAGRAECMRMLGQLEESLAWFDKALVVGSRHAFAVQGKAASLNALGRFEEALPLWEQALEIESTSTFAAEGKAVCERHLAASRADTPDVEETGDDEEGTPTLDEQARDLTALARAGKLSPVIGRQQEIRQVMKTLVRRLKANPLLLGEPGVGKTAVVEGVAQALVAADAPPKLRHLRILELSMGSILAGTKYRGTFEERLRSLVDEATRTPDVVLFIDEIHTLVGAGRTEGGALDAANILKPALARGEIAVIGATTVDEFRKHFEQDSALERRFQPIRVEEPTLEETETLLDGMLPLYAKHHGVEIGADVVPRCVQLAVRFMPERRLPDKALDVLDEACADANLDGATQVDAERVARVVSERTGVPVHTLTARERDRLGQLEVELGQRVVGQEEAVSELAAAVRLARSGLRDEKRPRGVFLFAGSSGVGKTELARSLADFLFPEGDALIKLDMSEYAERFTGSRLLGAPPGYQGHGEEGQLTGPLRNRPYSVVLLDEFEKAHPDVQAMFLSLFDDGVVTDAEGRRVQAREAFFILTTNAGSEGGARASLGFGGGSPRDVALDKVRDHFRPELFNRIDGVVVFRRLKDVGLESIVDQHLERLAERAAGAGVVLSWGHDVVRAVVAHKPDASLGARPALRALEELVAEPLGSRMLGADAPRRLHAVWKGDRVVFEEGVHGGPQSEQALSTEDDEPVS